MEGQGRLGYAVLRIHMAGERELFIDNLLVRIHFIIVMIRWTGLAPWEFEFPFPGRMEDQRRLGDAVLCRPHQDCLRPRTKKHSPQLRERCANRELHHPDAILCRPQQDCLRRWRCSQEPRIRTSLLGMEDPGRLGDGILCRPQPPCLRLQPSGCLSS